jgi:hypothetical protein
MEEELGKRGVGGEAWLIDSLCKNGSIAEKRR